MREESVEMLIAVQRGTGPATGGLSGAEARVIKMMRDWTGKHALTGVAMINVGVADVGGPRPVDALVFTPHSLLIMTIKGLNRLQHGRLRVPLTGPWKVDGEPLAGPPPDVEVRAARDAVKKALADVDGGSGSVVTGLVVLVPHGKNNLVLSGTAHAGRGIKIVLGRQRDLREFFHRLRGGRLTWTADAVLDACAKLDLAALAPRRSTLLAEGFPEHPLPPRTANSAPSPSHTGPGLAPSTPTTQAATAPPHPPRPPHLAPAPPAQPSVRADTRGDASPSRWRISWGLLAVLAVLALAGAAALLGVGTMFAGR
ncbi:hypothetical protein [Amycolatopsis magusensis]|uniref:hypothetical protein n=1 Tax=Amycolatopsis magusensis TaxID=882444 RepID=UPI0024A96CAD|nr:hypothetical protein [Amycolatopsis magusensis]MDI5979855.1 hypothetical protein [Amycolatopsis magusensis]